MVCVTIRTKRCWQLGRRRGLSLACYAKKFGTIHRATSGWVVLGIWIFNGSLAQLDERDSIAHQLSKYFTCRLFKHMYHAWTIVAYLMRRGVVDIVVVAADA